MWLKSTTTPHCFAYLRYIRILITSITSLNQNKIFWNFGFEKNRKHWQDRKLRLSWNGRRGYSTMNKLCEHDLISCPLCRVARRAATKDRHVCWFRASFWALTPQFGARCFLVFLSCAFLQVSSEGLCEWCCPALSSWRAQSISIAFPWLCSPCCLYCTRRVAVGWR